MEDVDSDPGGKNRSKTCYAAKKTSFLNKDLTGGAKIMIFKIIKHLVVN